MGYTIFEVSKELNINTTVLNNEIQKEDFEDYIYENDGIIYLKEQGIQKLLNKIDAKEIEFKSSLEYERELLVLRTELIEIKKQLEEKNKEVRELEKKISKRLSLEKKEIEEKIMLNVKSDFIKRSERNKKKRWF
ncbi:MAG: hypothetical protein ACRCTZ_03645 [Sarcina sp.]